MYQSFLLYRQFFYLKVSLAVVALSVLLYVVYQPTFQVANGGSWVGYFLGSVGAILIFWLMWLGVRKRCYRPDGAPLQAWVSAHVYLGFALVFIITLHTGFQFAWNIHTLAYMLMIAVVASGAYGIWAYLRYPQKMAEQQGGMSQDLILQEMIELEQECLQLATQINDTIHQAVLEAVEQTLVGNSAWQQLTQKQIYRGLSTKEKTAMVAAGISEESGYDSTMYLVAEEMSNIKDSEKSRLMRRLMELLGRKNTMADRLQNLVHYQALMDIWRYFHIPLSAALLAALMIHILTVFLYW
jgi:hypothetical protein